MEQMSLPGVQLDLSQEDLKLCLIALGLLSGVVVNRTLQPVAFKTIDDSERFYNFTYNTDLIKSDPVRFMETIIGGLCDKLYVVFYERAYMAGELKPLDDNYQPVDFEVASVVAKIREGL